MTEPVYEPIDRRPIQSRNTVWAEAATGRLVALGLSPNTISLAGMFAAIVAGLLFSATEVTSEGGARGLWLGGAILCQVRLLCNLFDGMVAVKCNIASRCGELYNEVPDRISDAAVFVGLGYAAGGDIAAGYVAALVAVFVAYVRAMAKSIGAPNDFSGPMAKPQRMAIVTAVAFYMAISPSAWRLPVGEVNIALVLVIAGGILTAARRLVRAARSLETSVS